MATISRQENNNLFGPTVGDKIRLANTDLYIQIEKDLRVYGDETVYGGGKTLRDGMGTANEITSDAGSLDLVITNVTILDPILGVIKADVGVKDGKIAGIGKAGNPNIMKVASMSNVLPSSTNPTLPYGINSQAELFDMIMVCHNLNPSIPSDVAFAESRVRPETQAAENIFHDLGIISMVSSDSQAMGRVGESFMRTFQMASYMKQVRGRLPEDSTENDNFRVLRYLAQITLNPAITYGISDVLGSIAVGKMADLVLWEPAFFGTKPKMVIKGGFINWADMGDPNASLPTPQPKIMRPMYGGFGKAMPQTCLRFVSRAGYENGVKECVATDNIFYPVHGIRQITKADMVLNGAMPQIEVDPETFNVYVDGVLATVPPAKELSLGQIYWFS